MFRTFIAGTMASALVQSGGGHGTLPADDLWAMRAAATVFTDLDRDGDALLAYEEAGNEPSLAARFSTADWSNDGQINVTEYARYLEWRTTSSLATLPEDPPGYGPRGCAEASGYTC